MPAATQAKWKRGSLSERKGEWHYYHRPYTWVWGRSYLTSPFEVDAVACRAAASRGRWGVVRGVVVARMLVHISASKDRKKWYVSFKGGPDDATGIGLVNSQYEEEDQKVYKSERAAKIAATKLLKKWQTAFETRSLKL